MIELLPHVNGVLNLIGTFVIFLGWIAIRKGNRQLHPKLMTTGVIIGGIFLVFYLIYTFTLGHQRFSGDDWLKKLFLLILITHTILAVISLPMILRTFYLALRGRFDEHRRIARITFPIWAYVCVTGFLIYWMVNHLRPAS